jgi:hypothetical protein
MEVRSIEAIARVLAVARVRYLVVGGLAVNAHGYERFTNDLDLVIGLERSNIIAGLDALQSIGYIMSIPVSAEAFASEENRSALQRDKGMVVLKMWSDQHAQTPIDIFVHEPFNFDIEYAQAVFESINNDLLMPIVGLSALLKMKAEAGRLQDLADIESLLRIQALKEGAV